jgi:hypothetical protein
MATLKARRITQPASIHQDVFQKSGFYLAFSAHDMQHNAS